MGMYNYPSADTVNARVGYYEYYSLAYAALFIPRTTSDRDARVAFIYSYIANNIPKLDAAMLYRFYLIRNVCFGGYVISFSGFCMHIGDYCVSRAEKDYIRRLKNQVF
jgi:hypothetical protein